MTPRTEAGAWADMQLLYEKQEREWLQFERSAETEHKEFIACKEALTVANIDASNAGI